MRDIPRRGMQRPHDPDVDPVPPPGLGQRVVARVEVLALLEVVGEASRRGWEGADGAAVESEEAGVLVLVGGGLGGRGRGRGGLLRLGILR